MLKRIKCCGIKRSEWRLFVRDKLILFIIKLYNLFFDLYWKNKVIGIRKGHDVMYRFMYVSTTLYVSNRIEATIYYLYVGIVRLGNLTCFNTGSVVECYLLMRGSGMS